MYQLGPDIVFLQQDRKIVGFIDWNNNDCMLTYKYSILTDWQFEK